MACQLDRVDNEELWLGLVGVTDQYLRGHISNAGYAVCYNELGGKVGSLNIQEKDGKDVLGVFNNHMNLDSCCIDSGHCMRVW